MKNNKNNNVKKKIKFEAFFINEKDYQNIKKKIKKVDDRFSNLEYKYLKYMKKTKIKV